MMMITLAEVEKNLSLPWLGIHHSELLDSLENTNAAPVLAALQPCF
jgi:hypothetical protein